MRPSTTTTSHRRRRQGAGQAARPGYLLLEVVVATGVLVVALAVIGAQIQDSGLAIHKMKRRMEAIRLAEQQLSFLDLGLVELESADEVEEGDFGSRFPDWGWVLITEPTAVEGIFRLNLEILHHVREGDYREDDFPHDEAELVYDVFAIRAAPLKVDFSADFGLTEDEVTEVTEKLQDSGVPFDPKAFDPSAPATWDIEQLIRSLPVLLDAFGLELGDLESMIPPELLQELQNEGVLDGPGEEGGDQP